MIPTIVFIVLAVILAIGLSIAGVVAFCWKQRARWWFIGSALCMALAAAALVWR